MCAWLRWILTRAQVIVPFSRKHVQLSAQQASPHNQKDQKATGVGIGLVLLKVLTYMYWQRAQQTATNEEEEQDLAGVGIVFVRAPDDSLFVKSVLDGSGATNSGIQTGDCLMKVSAWVLAAQHCVPFGLDVSLSLWSADRSHVCASVCRPSHLVYWGCEHYLVLGLHAGLMKCVSQVNGHNVYCRGIEVATKLILGPVDSVVKLKFGRIDRHVSCTPVRLMVTFLTATFMTAFLIHHQPPDCHPLHCY